jgi:predicted amidohydrolase
LKHYETLIRARAIENQMVMIAVNRVGKEGDNHFFGHSMIVDPWGETICSAREEETLLVCMFDVADILKIRRDFPVIGDIRSDALKQ